MESTPYLEDNVCTETGGSNHVTNGVAGDDNSEIQEMDSLKDQLQKAEEEVATLRQDLSTKLFLIQSLKRLIKLSKAKTDIVPSISIKKESNKYKIKKNTTKTAMEETGDTLNTEVTDAPSRPRVTRLSETLDSTEFKFDITNVSVKRTKLGKEKNSFAFGDKIFAKVRGFVYWPSRVNPIPEDILIPPNKIPIFFFGTHEVYFISPTYCWPFDDRNKAKWGKPNPRAHFNQALDEINNNPTLYQYGADPNAEEFLSQFYQFKRSDGVISSGVKQLKKQEPIVDDSKSTQSRNSSVKKRNKSGSSFKPKEEEGMITVPVDVERIKDEQDKKRNLSGSSVKKDEKKTIAPTIEVKESPKVEEKLIQMPLKTGKKKKEAIKKRWSSKSGIMDKNLGETQSELRLVGTGELADQMNKIEPTRKRHSSGMSSRTKEELNDTECKNTDEPQKEEDKSATAVVEMEQKCEESVGSVDIILDNTVNNVMVTAMGRIKAEIVLSDNSLNEDCKSRLRSRSRSASTPNEVQKRKKREPDSDNPNDEDFEPTKKLANISKKSVSKIPKIKKGELKSKQKGQCKFETKIKKPFVSDVDSLGSISSLEHSFGTDEKQRKRDKEVAKNAKKEELLKEELAIKVAIKESIKKIELDNTSVQIMLTDMTHDRLPKESSDNIEEVGESSSHDKEVIVPILFSDVVKHEAEFDETNARTDSTLVNDGPIMADLVSETAAVLKEVAEADNREIVLTASPKKSDIKLAKKEFVLQIKQKQSNNRKRKRFDKDDSEDEIPERAAKKMKSSRIIDDDSDCEIMDVKIVPMITTKSLPATTMPSTAERIKALQTYNSDIRSSLVLGHEDYGKCVDRFKSLCTIDLDLISLVTVWQLMDTVKKCRRYKRNESVKNEAQNVYKRFMEIYSQSSPDEIQKAQATLAQSKFNSSKTDTSLNGQVQNPTIPSSVEDMFHHHRDNNNKPQSQLLSNNEPIEPEKVKSKSPADDEEKMRLLSVDLEAKVSDILNKIEKNTSVLNPINRQSMTHLLPSMTEESLIQLPEKWESVDNNNHHRQHHHHHHHSQGRVSRNNDKMKIVSDDDDEDDVDAIVKRIEEVPILQMEVDDEEEEDEEGEIYEDEEDTGKLVIANDTRNMTFTSATSALDARIQNLFNTSLVAVNKTKKPRVSGRHGARTHAMTRDNNVGSSHSSGGGVSSRHNTSSTLMASSKTSPSKDMHHQASASVVKEHTRQITTTTSTNVTERILESTDNVIYSLLGV